MKTTLLASVAAGVFALGAVLAHAEDPERAQTAQTEPPAPDHDSLSTDADDDFAALRAGTCTCSSFLGAGCEVQNDRCSSGRHPECHCSFFGGNSCACKRN